MFVLYALYDIVTDVVTEVVKVTKALTIDDPGGICK